MEEEGRQNAGAFQALIEREWKEIDSILDSTLADRMQHDSSEAPDTDTVTCHGGSDSTVTCPGAGDSCGDDVTYHPATGGTGGAGDLQDFIKIAEKLLSRPGMQVELLKCIKEDKEVHEMLAKQTNMLEALRGIDVKLLQDRPCDGDDGDGGNHRSQPVGNSHESEDHHSEPPISKCFRKAGAWFNKRGHWLKDRIETVAAVLSGEKDDDNDDAAEHGKRQLGIGVAVPAVLAAVVCILIVRNPGLAHLAAAGVVAVAAAAHERAMAHQKRE